MAASEPLALLRVAVTEQDHSQGSPTAPVTLVEYGDYECPHCGRAHPIVKEVQRQLGKQLRFVFRNFPLAEAHAHAQHAAEAAEAAGAQGRFWEMHDALFEHQGALDDAHLAKYARAVGLDETRVTDALVSHEFATRVRRDFIGGVRSGVNGTPTFFINGVRHDDSWDVATLVSAVRAAIETV
jgi:protein-disulfide isomerase